MYGISSIESRAGAALAAYDYFGSNVRRRIYDSPTVTFGPVYDSFGRVTKHEITQNGSEAVNFTYSYDLKLTDFRPRGAFPSDE